MINAIKRKIRFEIECAKSLPAWIKKECHEMRISSAIRKRDRAVIRFHTHMVTACRPEDLERQKELEDDVHRWSYYIEYLESKR